MRFARSRRTEGGADPAKLGPQGLAAVPRREPRPGAGVPSVVRTHTAVLVRRGSTRALIDGRIAPLVLETWRAGVRTHCSCEDAGSLRDDDQMRGWVQLGFPSVEHARAWLRIVARHRRGRHTLYHRMTSALRERCRTRWRWEVSAFDAAYCWASGTNAGPTTLDFRVFVYFPRADLATVVRRLREHNRAPVTLRRPRDGSRTGHESGGKP